MLEVSGLSQAFKIDAGELTVLQDFSFQVARGQLLAVLGPSGCGKSSLLRILAGLDAPRAVASVRWQGEDSSFPEVAQQTSFMPQKPSLLPWLKVVDNVALAMRATCGVNAKQAHVEALELLDAVGLGAFALAYPDTLSGGMASRVAFARTLATKRPLLLLDEPFAAVDAINREALQNWLLEIWQPQWSGVFITHSLEEAALLADQVIVMGERGQPVVDRVEVDFWRPRKNKNSTNGATNFPCATEELRTSAQYLDLTQRLRTALRTSFVENQTADLEL